MAYTITLQTPEGDKQVTCEDDQYILDAAEEGGVDMNYSCLLYTSDAADE